MRLVNRSFAKRASYLLFRHVIITHDYLDVAVHVLCNSKVSPLIEKVTLTFFEEFAVSFCEEPLFVAAVAEPENLHTVVILCLGPWERPLSPRPPNPFPLMQLVGSLPWVRESPLKFEFVQTFFVRTLLKVYKPMAMKCTPFLNRLTVLDLHFNDATWTFSAAGERRVNELDWSEDDSKPANECLADMLQHAPNLVSLSLWMGGRFLDEDESMMNSMIPVKLEELLSRRQVWLNLQKVHLEGIYTEGSRLAKFLRTHQSTLRSVSLRHITFIPDEDMGESHQHDVGTFEIIHLLKTELQLRDCTITGDFAESYLNGIIWWIPDFEPDDYGRHDQYYEDEESYKEVEDVRAIAKPREGPLTKYLRPAVSDYILRNGPWPFPPRSWFESVNISPSFWAWQGKKYPVLEVKNCWRIDGRPVENPWAFGDDSWMGRKYDLEDHWWEDSEDSEEDENWEETED